MLFFENCSPSPNYYTTNVKECDIRIAYVGHACYNLLFGVNGEIEKFCSICKGNREEKASVLEKTEISLSPSKALLMPHFQYLLCCK